PSLRLDSVMDDVKWSDHLSVCDPDWSPLIADAFPLIVSCLGFGCLRDTLRDPKDPDCTATDVTQFPDGTETRTPLPRCDRDSRMPCWEFIERTECYQFSPQSLGFQVRRDFYGAPPHTSTLVQCAVSCAPLAP